ncbi:MAG: ATP-binding cassette domain-containing protein [Lachnospiraceae bacterium]|nr:ATP-binding cassette domain-containing protein [Lachnospiraceae bacterium]
MRNKKIIRKFIIILGWLLLWQLLSLWVDNQILLVGPVTTMAALFKRVVTFTFWKTIWFSFLRIGAGFLLGFSVGFLLAVLSARFQILEEIFSPFMTLIKAVPVASFVVLFLIWWHSHVLAVAISFCVVLPQIYISTLQGLKSADKELLEMAKVLHVPLWNRCFYIYRPALNPFLTASLRIVVGMSWKSGVAAEVIGTPDFSIGEGLYMAKITLDTAGILAWSAVIILISILCEKALLKLWEKFMAWEPPCRTVKRSAYDRIRERKINSSSEVSSVLAMKAGEPEATESCHQTEEQIEKRNTDCEERNDIRKEHKSQDAQVSILTIKHLYKSYGANEVLKDFSASYAPDETIRFTWPSGGGKTTLFRLIAGLEPADAGEIDLRGSRLTMLFQEDRLCMDYDALTNVSMVTGSKAAAAEYLKDLLPEEDGKKPCAELSGGMRRRVALARALAVPADIVILDEPYTGLDEENRQNVAACIEKHSTGKLVLMATHI